jgi:hypothetical protein
MRTAHLPIRLVIVPGRHPDYCSNNAIFQSGVWNNGVI